MNEFDSRIVATRFGEFIKAGRLKKNLTQTEVAKRLNRAQSYYNYLESGGRNVDLSLAMELCRILDLDLNDFVNSLNNDRPSTF